jgi:hypothetical protein
MRTSLTRAVAGVAIAATAVLAAAGAASASTTTAKTPTTLSIVAAKNPITVGQWDTISGTLSAGTTPLPGRIVILDVYGAKSKKWKSVEAKLTGKSGTVNFAVRPLVSTYYALVYKGGHIYAGSHSGAVLVVVNPFVKVATTLSIAQSVTAPVPAGTSDTISGALTLTKSGKALPHQWVWLAWVGSKGKAHLEKAFLTGKLGAVAFKVKPAKTTTYELVYLGTKVLAPTVSAPVTVTVTS